MHAAIIATLPSTANNPYTLTVGGSDMNVTGVAPTSYVVPLQSIRVTDQGPGQVSSMSFAVWDPASEVVVDDMAEVEFWDVTNGICLFAGFVQAVSVDSAAVGRVLAIECVGAEALLDWLVVPTATIAAGTGVQDAIQRLVALAVGSAPRLRALASSGPNGTKALPIGDLTSPKMPTAVTLSEAVSVDGDSLREAIRKVLDVAQTGAWFIFGAQNIYGQVTVDTYWGLRVWLMDNVPGGYAALTLKDDGTAQGFSALSYESNGLVVPQGVYIKGGNAAGTGVYLTGTGKPGPIAFIADETITTTVGRDNAAISYLERNTQTSITGSVVIEAWAPTTDIHAASNLALTVASATRTYHITSITKTFVAAIQSWSVEFGAVRPRISRQNRRRTRAVRS